MLNHSLCHFFSVILLQIAIFFIFSFFFVVEELLETQKKISWGGKKKSLDSPFPHLFVPTNLRLLYFFLDVSI